MEKKFNIHEELKKVDRHAWEDHCRIIDTYAAEQITNFLRILNKTGGVIAGGFVRYLVHGFNFPDDIDIWSFDEYQFNDIHNELVSSGMELINSNDRTNVYKFGWKYSKSHGSLPCLVQLIRPVDGVRAAEELMDTFDLTICKAFLTAEGDVFVHPLMEEHHREYKLVVEQCRMPLSTIKRIIKYSGKGWNVSTDELVKVMDAWGTLNAEQKQEAIKKTSSQIYNLIAV